jgi:hypothetical protein
MNVPGAVETAGPVEVSPLCPDRGRDAGRDDVGFVGMCFPRPLLVVSSGAPAESRHPHDPAGYDRKRRLREDISMDVPGAVETAGPVEVSPLCPDRGRDAGRDDVGFVGMCFPRPLLVVSSEASAQSRHPHEPVGCDRKRRLREDVSTDVPGAVETAGPLGVSPLRAAGALRSRRRWFAGGWLLLRDTPPPPATGRIEGDVSNILDSHLSCLPFLHSPQSFSCAQESPLRRTCNILDTQRHEVTESLLRRFVF